MADKQISELPEVLEVADDTLIPVYVPGSATPAQRMTGAQFRMFAVDAAQGQAEKAEAAATEAEAAKEAAVLARDVIEQYVTDAQTAASLAEEAQVAAETAEAGAEAALADVQAAKDAVDITKADIDSTALQVAADKEAAETAKTAAETAQKASESAQTSAEGATTSASEKAAEAAASADTAAQDAQAAADARAAIENMLVEAVSLASGQPATVSKELVGGVVKLVFGLPAGDKGDPGSSIQSIDRTAGTGAPGTTDTYTVTMTDGSTTEFYVYNGKDGAGAGDMTAQVYDPQGKALDIYEYADNAAMAAEEAANSYTDQQIAAIPAPEETDPTVPDWAKQPTKPTYTANEVGAKAADDSDVFIATYGTTTSAEIEAAYQAGKAVYCKFNNYTPRSVLTARMNSTYHIFTVTTQSSIGMYYCMNDSWSVSIEQYKPANHASTHASGGNDALYGLYTADTNPTTNNFINWTYE